MPVSIHQALREGRRQLGNTADAALETEILLAFCLDQTRTYLHTWPEKPLVEKQRANFVALLQRRAAGEPIAYLTGERDFWDMTLQVTPDTLIPRPETETLVEQALQRIPADARWRIADLGTGSGAIALAIARERPGCRLLATDSSTAALAVAANNARRLGVDNVRFAAGVWCEALGDQRFEMIVSNPPYVAPDDPHLQQGDLRFEPTTALAAADGGLADIRHICRAARDHLQAPGWLLLEHGYDQGAKIPAILRDLDYRAVQTVQDLARQDRISLGAWRC